MVILVGCWGMAIIAGFFQVCFDYSNYNYSYFQVSFAPRYKGAKTQSQKGCKYSQIIKIIFTFCGADSGLNPHSTLQ
jgi:hypothetical protein